MLWIAVGLFVLGVACGALIRLFAFAGVLICGAVIAGVAMAGQGLGAAVLGVLVTIVALQVGYAAGFVLRAAGRSYYTGATGRSGRKPPVTAPIGEKRR